MIADKSDDMPDFIAGTEMDKVYFNVDTTRRILAEVMEKGIKVEGGDKLGKTIIFARRHEHAQFIEEQFNLLYPEYNGKFARVMDHKAEYHKKLLDDFREKDKLPQIAISVDMLDTGIDVPEIVNLVFYKQVFSKAKFWQMFGRGTRLCPDLFGSGEDKKVFYIFDYMGNFAFFAQNPKGKDVPDSGSLTEKIFALKVHMMRELQASEYQTPELVAYRTALVDEAVSAIGGLNDLRFQVRQNLQYVEKYKTPAAFAYLEVVSSEELIAHIAPLIPPGSGEESAKRLDAILYRMMLLRARHEDFWHEVGSHDEYKKDTKDAPLGKFVRSLTGLSREAAHKAFSAFLDESAYNEEQIGLIQNIMEWIIANGTMERTDIRNADNLGGMAITEVFDVPAIQNILAIIDRINANASPTAA